MKLRNKKTGEIAYINIEFPIMKGDEVIGSYSIYNLAELNEEWEDYIPAEPLIKDEKIRKAVRAWADAFEIEKVYFDAKMLRFYDRKCKFVISVGYPIIGIWDKKDGYTITELCGEEEE